MTGATQHNGWPPVRRFRANECGRDFVIGDVHGVFDRVWEAMKAVRFNPNVDRLFAVGDLIDRGPGSHRCVKFLQLPYVFSVMGNHEYDLISLYENGPPDESVLRFLTRLNGLSWWMTLLANERERILDALRPLPLVIEIETRRGLVGIIHGEVPIGMDWRSFVARIDAGDPSAVWSCLKGRERVKQSNTSPVPGVGRIFSGHTPQYDGVLRLGNVFIVDCGAVFNELGRAPDGRLAAVNVAMRTDSLINRPNKRNGLNVCDGTVPSQPFGTSMVGRR